MIHSQNFITVFALYVHMWYLLKTLSVVLVTSYVTLVMVVARIIAVNS